MKLVPSLAPISAHGPPVSTAGMERLGLFSPDLLWRYPSINFTSPSPLAAANMDFKTHLPAALGGDPRLWSREDVVAFLRWAEYEFDLPTFDLEMFQMNGKALCLLTKADLNERTPGSGDVLHNVLQMLVRDSRAALPSSPLTPHFPLTPSWSFNAPPIEFPTTPFSSAAPVSLNSVTLSPAPSVDSAAGSPRSPRHADHALPPVLYGANAYSGSGQSTSGSGSAAGSSGSNQSDSEVEDQQPPRPPATPNRSPPPTHSPAPPHTPTHRHQSVFFPSDQVTSEPNTNGRLLWDFLQQLLNDSLQRYTAYIAWKNREIGVFKIVDPPGLAKLWGIQKNHLSMNYDKMSRALRYYYRVNILRKVQGERHCYQFLRNPSELKSIKNISLLRQQMSSNTDQPQTQQQQQQQQVKSEPVETEEERPTDLSINNHHFRLSASSDFEYMRNPSELKIMKNLHTLREQRLANTNTSQSQSQPESQPHDLSFGAMQLSLNLAAEQLPRPRDLSPRLPSHPVKEEGERQAS